MVGRRPQHAVSKLPCLVLSSAISCRSSICLGRLSTAGLLCRIFLSYGLQVVTREVHQSSLRWLMCPAQDYFIFLTLLIISMTFILSVIQLLVFLSLNVMLSILFFHFDQCGGKFILCLFGVCPVCKICHSWQHTGVVHMSLQADGKVNFENIPLFGMPPACHDS